MINEIGDERRRGGRGNNNDAAYILKAAEIAGMPRAKLSLVMPVKQKIQVAMDGSSCSASVSFKSKCLHIH